MRIRTRTYAGTLVQGKTCKPDFRRKAVLSVDESEWDRSPGAHEAIVDPATFGLVRKLARRDMRLSPGAKRSLPLSGFLFCADCGATMARHASCCSSGKRFYYSCETHRKNRAECGMHKVWEDELSAAVMRVVHGHALAAVDGDGAVRGAEAYRHDRRAELACRLGVGGGRIEHNGDLRLRMYSDYAAGVIDKAQYASSPGPSTPGCRAEGVRRPASSANRSSWTTCARRPGSKPWRAIATPRASSA